MFAVDGRTIKSNLIQQYNLMLKKQPASDSLSAFSLIGKDQGCVFEAVTVDFRPPFNMNKASNSITPTFFQDGNWYTPAFILPREKEYYEKNKEFERINFDEKIFQVLTRTQQIQNQGTRQASFIAPAPENNRCQVCKISFASYFCHIQQTSHKIKVSQNNSNKHIYQLCQAYSHQLPPWPRAKKKCRKMRKNFRISPNHRTYALRLRSEANKQQSLGFRQIEPGDLQTNPNY